MRRAATLVAAVLAGVAGSIPALGAGAGASAARTRAHGAPATAALEQSWTNGAGTWAVVAMGHLHQVRNTFWQVFFRPAGKVRWTLVTPPGVASNGGFAAAATDVSNGPGVVTAGFEPSRKLEYSPIARTSNDGKSWVAGTLPSALLPVADAVVTAPGGTVFALVRAGGGTLLRSKGSLTSWVTVARRGAFSAALAARSCGVATLTAVAAPAAGGPSVELGTSCTKEGVVGLFHRSRSGEWASTSVRVPGSARDELTVVRLECGARGTSALVEARRSNGAKGASLVALWRSGPTASWTTSSPMPLHGSVLSTATFGRGSFLVVTGRGVHAGNLLWSGGPGTSWRSLGAPPAGTQAVSAGPGAAPAAASPAASASSSGGSAASSSSQDGASGPGVLSALAVSGSVVTVWQRSAAGAWTRTAQRLRIPIEYGSST